MSSDATNDYKAIALEPKMMVRIQKYRLFYRSSGKR